MPRPNAIGKPKPKIEDPMGKLKRLFCYIFKSYGTSLIFLCLSVLLSAYLPMCREPCYAVVVR